MTGGLVDGESLKAGPCHSDNEVVGATAPHRPPRLVLRFALYSAVALLLAGVAILWYVRHEAQQRAERSVGEHARLVAEALSDHLEPADFEQPVRNARLRALDAVVEEQLDGGVVRINLWGRDGTLTYSSAHALIGRVEGDLVDLGRALRGEVVREVGRLDDDAGGGGTKVLEAYVPFRMTGANAPVGVLEVYQDYAPVAGQINAVLAPVAVALTLALLALWVTLLPILRQVMRTLEQRNARLTEQADALERSLADRRHAETSLREAEASYHALIEQLPLVTYMTKLDETSSMIYVSPQVEELVGYSPAEILADPGFFPRLLHPDDRERVLAEHARAYTRGESFSTEYRRVARDGRVVWVHDEVMVVRDASGRPRHAQGFMIDITERKQAEEARRQLAAIVESSGDAIISVDLAGRITSWNAGAESLYGYSAAEIIGRSVAILAPPERSTEPLAYLERIKAGEAVAQGETVRARKDGTLIDVSLTISPLRDAAGNIIGASAITRDVTERKRTERELERLLALEREQNERLREFDKLKDEFLALVSHELRTPLTSIRGYLELLLDGEAGEITADQRKFLGVVERNAHRLLDLVSDLLLLAQIEAGKLVLDLDPVDLGAVASESVEASRPLAEEREITLTLATDTVPTLPADRGRVAQLLDNLVSNALKFTPPGGRVDVRVRSLRGTAVIEVRDTGVGIPSDEQDRLFERFFRSSIATAQAIPGTGLGLAITKAIVEAHGGRITVASEEGVGTSFKVALPVRQPQLSEAERESVAL
jgi:PAS domain S-box-containing protein